MMYQLFGTDSENEEETSHHTEKDKPTSPVGDLSESIVLEQIDEVLNAMPDVITKNDAAKEVKGPVIRSIEIIPVEQR